MTMQLISANHASAKAAMLAARANRKARGFCSGVYPITPQTECIEHLCGEEIEKGSVVRVESEHSAMAVCIGAALSGARTFTASSSNGLAYMAENVFTAGFFRLPVVMMAVNRTLGPPWNIWVDHGDTLMLRDSGWIQLYCEDNQEVADSTILAYRLAEDARVLLPVMVCQDAFVLSHTMMMTNIPSQKQVDAGGIFKNGTLRCRSSRRAALGVAVSTESRKRPFVKSDGGSRCSSDEYFMQICTP